MPIPTGPLTKREVHAADLEEWALCLESVAQDPQIGAAEAALCAEMAEDLDVIIVAIRRPAVQKSRLRRRQERVGAWLRRS